MYSSFENRSARTRMASSRNTVKQAPSVILDPKKNDYTIPLDDRLNCSLLMLRVDIPWPRAQLRRSGTIKCEFEISVIKSIIHRNFL